MINTDTLPFLRLTAKTPEGKLTELESYLIQFKEALEFILMEIPMNSLSSGTIDKINSLGAGNAEEELAQVSSKPISVSDVCNSDVFKAAVNEQISGITFSVNYSTGYLEFETNGG